LIYMYEVTIVKLLWAYSCLQGVYAYGYRGPEAPTGPNALYYPDFCARPSYKPIISRNGGTSVYYRKLNLYIRHNKRANYIRRMNIAK
jgi:hypothetical protein